jgi:hypothetical protein
MRDAFSLTFEQITSIGAALGALLVGVYTAWRGYWSKKAAVPTVMVPAAVMSPEVMEKLDRIENYVRHTEDKVDDLTDKVGRVYTDTQVLRDRKG